MARPCVCLNELITELICIYPVSGAQGNSVCLLAAMHDQRFAVCKTQNFLANRNTAW